MLAIIGNCSLRNIKSKLVVLYVLNLADLVFTMILLGTGLFREINLIMLFALKNPVICIILKIVLPAALLLYLNIRIRNACSAKLRVANILINVIISFYILINLHHIIWLVITAIIA